MSLKTHKDLDVWKQAMDLVFDVYQLTKSFPTEEKYGIIAQMRRSAVSIPSNLSEGAARNGTKEFIHFLYTSLGSLSELDTQLQISERLGYPTNKNINTKLENIRKMILGLIKYQKSKI